MSLADVYLILSLMKDLFPKKVLEAMSAGKAIRKPILNKSKIKELGKNTKQSFSNSYTIKHFNQRWR